jgi:hypothetical protein
MYVSDIPLMRRRHRWFGREEGYANSEDASEIRDPEVELVVMDRIL